MDHDHLVPECDQKAEEHSTDNSFGRRIEAQPQPPVGHQNDDENNNQCRATHYSTARSWPPVQPPIITRVAQRTTTDNAWVDTQATAHCR